MNEPGLPPFPAEWQPALAHSRYLRQLLAAQPELVPWLNAHWQQALDLPTLRTALDELLSGASLSDDAQLKQVLRRLRQRIMACLIVRDLAGLAPLEEVIETMTLLADFCVNHALAFLHRQLVENFGEPLDHNGQPQRLMVIGMGKLGGRELNVSSDIDLIFVYPEV